jgi:hypothetical protein
MESQWVDRPEHVGLAVITHAATGQLALAAMRHFIAGETIVMFSARASFNAPGRMTVQIDVDSHIELSPWFLSYTNHGCDPTVAFDTARGALVALRALAPGDELTFFYPSTEWFMAEPFTCSCGSVRCLGLIAGASRMAPELLAAYWLAPHVRALLGAARQDEAGALCEAPSAC